MGHKQGTRGPARSPCARACYGACIWRCAALAAITAGTDDPWFAAKVTTARFYAVNLLPRVHGLVDASMSGADLVFAVGDDLMGT